MSRNPEKPDEGDGEALCAQSDVEAKGRHDEAEGGKALVPHQLKDESCDREEKLKLLYGRVLQKSYDHTVLTKLPNSSGELGKSFNRRAACVRPHRKMLPRMDAAADGDKPSVQTPKSNSDAKSFHVSSDSCSSPLPYLPRNSQSQFSTNEPTGCRYSPDLYRKSKRSTRDKKKMPCAVTADSSCKLETTQAVTNRERTKRNPDKVNKEPWR